MQHGPTAGVLALAVGGIALTANAMAGKRLTMAAMREAQFW